MGFISYLNRLKVLVVVNMDHIVLYDVTFCISEEFLAYIFRVEEYLLP